MKFKKTAFFCCLIAIFTAFYASAQERKVAPTSQQLYKEIAHADSILFAAFNTQNIEVFEAMFTADLEWFQDNSGLVPRETVFKNFGIMFKNENKLTRRLVPGSLDVHPIKGYGAIQTGQHIFRHFENGKEETGTFKFMMIWKLTDGKWQISRVISYDH